MSKRTFVPATDRLEGRVVLSDIPTAFGGVPHLTPNAVGEAKARVIHAYENFAHNLNTSQLDGGIVSAANLIPFARRDGLLKSLQATENTAEKQILAGKGINAVFSALQKSDTALEKFLKTETSKGRIVFF